MEFDSWKGKGDISVLQNFTCDNGACPASYAVGSRRSFLLCKGNRGMKLTPYLHLAQTLKMCGVILLLPIVWLYDVDRNNLNFTLSVHNCALVEDNIAVRQRKIVWKIIHWIELVQ
jgi:hypothetical protein